MTKPTDLSFTIEDLDKAMSKNKSSAGESKTPPCPPSQKTHYRYIIGVERKRLIEIDKALHHHENSIVRHNANLLLDIVDTEQD